MDQLLAFTATAIALVGSPGPNTLSLAATAAAFGAKRASGYMLGLLLGMAAVIALTAAGVTGLILAQPGIAPLIVWLAVGYFLYLAYRIATAPPIQHGGSQAKPPGLVAGMAMSLSNPKAYAAVGATLSGYTLITGEPLLDMLAKSAGLALTILVVNIIWLNAGAALTKSLKNPKTSRRINIAFAAALLISVAITLI